MVKADELAAALKGEGCLGKAADDEPVFVLRAQDALAPDVIRHWADTVEMRHRSNGTLDGKIKERIAEARGLAMKMDRWPTRKLPD